MHGRRLAASVVSSAYMPQVRVLAESFAAHHPGSRLAVLSVDGLEQEAGGDESFEVVSMSDVGISPRELHHRAMIYTPQGLAGSMWPRVVSHVLERGDSVLQIDADMEVLGPLDDLFDVARDHGVVLTPHSHDPIDGAPGSWPEEDFLRSGTFNAGFLGVGARAQEFLDWLTARLDRDCYTDHPRGLQHEQKWLNLVPSLFPHTILRDRGVNAMVHTLRGRDVDWIDDRPFVAGDPVRLFHFAGYRPDEPERLCAYYDADFVRIDNRPGLMRLTQAYGERLCRSGWPAPRKSKWTTLPNGVPVDKIMKSVYRNALLRAEAEGGQEPPDAFAETDSFMRWLRDPGPPGISRYLTELRGVRADLREAFPDVPGTDAERYLDWALHTPELGNDLKPSA